MPFDHPGISRPVLGVFDSGVGGLTVVAALRRALPSVDLLFLGDTARLPYGTKSPETVARYTQNNVALLQRRGVSAVVVACNTASATGIDRLRVDLPVWGVIEPGAKLAVERSSACLGIVATEATIRSGAYVRAVHGVDPSLRVLCQATPLLVPLVEEGWLDDPITEQVLQRYLEPLLEAGIDALLLGCTHYPLLKPLIRRLVGDSITIVDSAEAVSERVARQWPVVSSSWESAESGSVAGGGSLELLVTDAGPRFVEIARRILAEPIRLTAVDVEPASSAQPHPVNEPTASTSDPGRT